MKKSKPVTIITGFLGSGKTTLINKILTGQQNRKFAVIVNEFGDLGIDGDLIVGTDDEVVELTNGCLCCSVRGDLIEALKTLRPRLPDIDGVIIETSGLADPIPVAQTFLTDEDDSKFYHLDGIVTLVDSQHFKATSDTDSVTINQVAFADLLVLTKTDMIPGNKLAELRKALRKINPHSDILEARHGKIPDAEILNIGTFDASRIEIPTIGHHHADHLSGIQSVCLSSDRPIDPDNFARWVQQLLVFDGERLLRSKGIINFTGETRKFVFQGVQAVVEGDVQNPWPDGPRVSRMVVIGRDLNTEQIKAGWNSCLEGYTDQSLSGISLQRAQTSMAENTNQ